MGNVIALVAPLSKVAAYTPTSNILAVPAVKTVAYPRITPGYLPPAPIATPIYKGLFRTLHIWLRMRGPLQFLFGSLFLAPAYAVTPAPYVSTYVSAPKAIVSPPVYQVRHFSCGHFLRAQNSYKMVRVSRFFLLIESRLYNGWSWFDGIRLDILEQCVPFDASHFIDRSRTCPWLM